MHEIGIHQPLNLLIRSICIVSFLLIYLIKNHMRTNTSLFVTWIYADWSKGSSLYWVAACIATESSQFVRSSDNHSDVMASKITDKLTVNSTSCAGKSHRKRQSSSLLQGCEGNPLITGSFLHKRPVDAECARMPCHLNAVVSLQKCCFVTITISAVVPRYSYIQTLRAILKAMTGTFPQ